MSFLDETIKTLYRVQAHNRGVFPTVHYIDAVEFERLKQEVGALNGQKAATIGGVKLLDVPVRP